MAKFRPIKKHGTGLERWKDEKNWKRTAKNGITSPKKDWKEWKDPFQEREKTKKNLERERSFLNRSVFLSIPVPIKFGQRTSLVGKGEIVFQVPVS